MEVKGQKRERGSRKVGRGSGRGEVIEGGGVECGGVGGKGSERGMGM